jgi:hypothetical protein
MMLEGLKDKLGKTRDQPYAQSTYLICKTCINLLYSDSCNREPCLIVSICFRGINHMAVENHLHSSSGVRKVVSGTFKYIYIYIAKTKVGRKWCYLVGNASVLWRWTLFFNFKGTPSRILHKMFCRQLEHKLLVMWEIIGEALKIMCSANQFAETWY